MGPRSPRTSGSAAFLEALEVKVQTPVKEKQNGSLFDLF